MWLEFRRVLFRSSYIISSKVFFGAGGKLPTQRGLHRKHVVEACEQAIKRLKTDFLDLYFCHRPDKNTPVEETVWTMHNLIQQGKILYWGTSEWSAMEIMEAHAAAERYNLIGPTMEQPQYNMFVRDKVEVEFSQIYKTVGLGTTIWSPLCSGLLTGKYNNSIEASSRLKRDELGWLAERLLVQENFDKVADLMSLANELELSIPVMSIAWVLKNPNVSTAILGASKESQLLENLKALDAVDLLTDDVMARIETILNNTPVRPQYWSNENWYPHGSAEIIGKSVRW